MTQFDGLPGLRRPEYTGENRCLPCTVVNLLLAGLGGVVLGLATRPVAGVLAFGVGGLLIYLRGYLVPWTPTLTRRYFPPWLLQAFGKDTPGTRRIERGEATAQGSGAPGDDGEADDPLVAAGVISRGDDPDVTPAFREEWHSRMDTVGDGAIEAGMVAAAFGATTAERVGAASFVVDGEASLRWGSAAALVADVAGADLLDSRLAAWAEFDRDTRRSILMGLRLCLSECPGCGGSVRVDEDLIDPCCEKPHRVAEAVCTDCGAPLADAAVLDSETETTVSASLVQSA